MTQTKRIILTLIVAFCAVLQSNGQDLVYTPKNPAFGGNFLNYNWLLNSASSQNDFQENLQEQDQIADFEENFNDQFLSQFTRELLRNNEVFGENGLQTGTFEVGNLLLNVVPGLNGLVVTITNISSGSQTQITIPFD